MSRAKIGYRVKPKPQQLDVHKERDAAAAEAARRYCPEPDCVVELRPWQKAHAGLHSAGPLDQWRRRRQEAASWTLFKLPEVGPWMWGRVDVGDRFRLGNLGEVKDAALGRVIFTHCSPEDIDVYERTIGALQAGRSIVGV